METLPPTQPFHFLQHGGEMGSLTRHYDWSQTSIGTPDGWPQSLRITLSNLLHSAFPMFLFWGADAICFYNGAYRPSLGDGGKHPAVGKAGKEVWPEIWNFIGPLIEGVMETGEPVWFEDQFLPIYRNEKLEDVYWTFSYSLVLNDEGGPGGVLVTCMETTGAVNARKQLEESEERFRAVIDQAPVAMTITRGMDVVIESINASMLGLMNKSSKEDVVGKAMLDVLPELKGQPALQTVLNVQETGVPFRGDEQPVELMVNGERKRFYFDFSYTPIIEDGVVAAVLHVAIDVTQQVLIRRMVEESEAKLRSILNSAPTAIAVFAGPDLIVENANQLMIEVMAAGPDIEGKSFRKLLAGLVEEDQKFLQIIDGVRATGQPFEAPEVEVYFKAERKTRYFNISFIPLQDEAGAIYAVLDVSVDVTEQVTTRKKIEESEVKFRLLIQEAPFATALYTGPELTIDTVNEAMLKIWDKPASVAGKTFEQALPELKGQPFSDLLKNVYRTGEEYVAKGQPADIMIAGRMQRGWYDFTYKPIRNEKGDVYGIVHMATEVTEQVLSRQKIEASQRSLLTLFEESPVGIATISTTDEFVFEFANTFYGSLVGRRPEELMGKPLLEALPELKDQGFEGLLKQVVATGLPFEAKELPAQVMRGGKLETIYIDFSYHPRKDVKGTITGILAVVIDVSEQVRSRRQVERNEKQLETALEQARLSKEAAELGTFDLDLLKGTLHWDDRCRILFGITHHQPVSYEKDFVEGLHPDDRERILAVIEKSFIKAVSNGEYDVEYRTIGAEDGLERWVKAKGKVYFNEAETPIRFIGSVLDITGPMTAMQKIERTVEERTKELAAANTALQTANKELQRSNANLEEFAHAASHDLKEPIRKITFFTHQLKDQLADHLKENEQHSFNRIENATERMGNLIDDLLLYSHVSQRPHEMEKIDLNVKVQRVLEDLELDVEHKKAVINVGKLPVIQGYRRQLQQLFQNLISNALKYSKTDIPPHIEISAGEAEENGKRYNVISVKDNGIGFNQDYAEKIFQMFTRLHGRSEYSGTGVGLSIVKKVVENHNGFIRTESVVGEGSVFRIYLPV